MMPSLAIALLAASWMFGLSYYEPASAAMCAALVAVAMGLLLRRDESSHAATQLSPLAAAAIVALLLPVALSTPLPYALGPSILALSVALATFARSTIHRRVVGSMMTAGLLLIAQAVVMEVYRYVTARSHELPDFIANVLALLGRACAIDAAADGSTLVFRSLRQTHRLAVTWDTFFDPVTACFLAGGLVYIACTALASSGATRAKVAVQAWLWRSAEFALVVLLWLPVRSALLIAFYLHRDGRSDPSQPSHLMSQYVSQWMLLLLGIVLAVWTAALLHRLSSIGRQAPDSPVEPPTLAEATTAAPAPAAWAAAGCCLFGSLLVALGLLWEPVGARKSGRVMFVERHSVSERTDRPYDTEHFGGGDDEKSFSYHYTLAYDYLGQYYQMSRLDEKDAIDDAALSKCDVLVVKLPTSRYAPDEVRAVQRFVDSGGGLLLIGDHTNLDHTSAAMNDITRAMGFTFRDDVLYSSQPHPDEQHYGSPRLPHPAMQFVDEFDFLISCSIDPGTSSGRPIVASTGLWSMPADYHYFNTMPFAQHLPETRFGSFIQAWSTHYGRGRAAAWADSTIFSNFCLYQPGKAEVLLNLVEWLNHQGSGLPLWWLVTGFGLCAMAVGGWLSLRSSGTPTITIVLLVAATACGWSTGVAGVDRIQRWSMPVPEKLRPRPLVVIDRTVSQVPLSSGAYADDKVTYQGYWLLEQWIPRLGYVTTRGQNGDALQGDALLVIAPSRGASQAYRDRLARYVAQGGRLIVFDAGKETVPSTANQILGPFGLALDYSGNVRGDLDLPGGLPKLPIDQAWPVVGGQSIAALGGKSVAAVTKFGKGSVMAVGFGGQFNDDSLGREWSHNPDAAKNEPQRNQILFALLRLAVAGTPLDSAAAQPPVGDKAKPNEPAEPKIKLPLDRRKLK